jgi:hypothetical protein
MIKLKLTRFSMTDKFTLGILSDKSNGQYIAVTLENPWLDNARDISCVPAGRYTCVPVNSSKFGQTHKLMNVKDRDGILFHAGNTERDTSGCILLGSMFGLINDQVSVLQSRVACNTLQAMVGKETFALEIIDT